MQLFLKVDDLFQHNGKKGYDKLNMYYCPAVNIF